MCFIAAVTSVQTVDLAVYPNKLQDNPIESNENNQSVFEMNPKSLLKTCTHLQEINCVFKQVYGMN